MCILIHFSKYMGRGREVGNLVMAIKNKIK